MKRIAAALLVALAALTASASAASAAPDTATTDGGWGRRWG